jgi:hypothetical protein
MMGAQLDSCGFLSCPKGGHMEGPSSAGLSPVSKQLPFTREEDASEQADSSEVESSDENARCLLDAEGTAGTMLSDGAQAAAGEGKRAPQRHVAAVPAMRVR